MWGQILVCCSRPVNWTVGKSINMWKKQASLWGHRAAFSFLFLFFKVRSEVRRREMGLKGRGAHKRMRVSGRAGELKDRPSRNRHAEEERLKLSMSRFTIHLLCWTKTCCLVLIGIELLHTQLFYIFFPLNFFGLWILNAAVNTKSDPNYQPSMYLDGGRGGAPTCLSTNENPGSSVECCPLHFPLLSLQGVPESLLSGGHLRGPHLF